jgi:hypothetical protein
MTGITIFECGPQTKQCRCDCGGGHTICEHVFEGEAPITDGEGRVCGATTVCNRCGLSAYSHSIWTGD